MNVLLQGVVGSTAYGLAGPESDIDRIGVFAVPTVELHGLHLPNMRDSSIVTTNPDLTLHEARKAALLMLNGNPTITELLWMDSYEVTTPLGAELVALRRAFLSVGRVRAAYLGYVGDQLGRLIAKGEFKSTYRARSEKHARHILRLLVQGLDLYRTGRLTLQLENPQRFFEFGRVAADNPDHVKRTLAAFEAEFDAARSPLPNEPDEAAIEAWLRRVRLWFLPSGAVDFRHTVGVQFGSGNAQTNHF